MYLCVSCTGNLRAGDILILEKNKEFNDVVAKMIGGGVVGFVTDIQPEGCVSKSFVSDRIGSGRIIGRAVIRNNCVALFSCDSPMFENAENFVRMGETNVRRKQIFTKK